MRILKSHQCTLSSLDPWFITGFTDGEGCFTLNLARNQKLKIGWEVKNGFQISLHEKDITLLTQIKNYFGVGIINKHSSRSIQFRVQSVKDLAIVISHFDKYPLITQKQADYLLFKEALNLINKKEHLTIEGLKKIVAIKGSMNLGLSEELKTAFLDVLPVPRPLVVDQEIKDPNWLAGFTSAEGCFLIKIIKSSSFSIGFYVQLIFQLTQHTRDIALMQSLVKFWDCGNCTVRSNKIACEVDSNAPPPTPCTKRQIIISTRPVDCAHMYDAKVKMIIEAI